jgi:hypothetical protein
MAESTDTALLAEGRLDDELVERAIAAAAERPWEERASAVLEQIVARAEVDPGAARSTLSRLRGDHAALARLEACLGGRSERATLALGAAIQLAVSELSSPAPDLRSRLPELTRWLERRW